MGTEVTSRKGLCESVSGVQQRSIILKLFYAVCDESVSYLNFSITKGLVNALMKLAGLSTSNEVKNH